MPQPGWTASRHRGRPCLRSPRADRSRPNRGDPGGCMAACRGNRAAAGAGRGAPCGVSHYHEAMPGAAFFDLDRTVVARPSGLAFGNNFYHAGLISRSILIRGYIAQTIYLMRGADAARMEKWRLQGLDLTRGYEREGFGRIIQASMAEVIGPIIYSEAIEAMEWHRSMRRKVYLVSSSPEEFACPIGEMLGVDGVIATRSKV